MLSEIKEREFLHTHIAKSGFDLINALLKKEINFSILCYINNVTFKPIIPSNININLKSITLFSLTGYTFTTADLSQEKIAFEAGFGEQNFPSNVTVPLRDILQILIGEHVIFVNPFANGLTLPITRKEDELVASMQAILSNPKNQKTFRQ